MAAIDKGSLVQHNKKPCRRKQNVGPTLIGLVEVQSGPFRLLAECKIGVTWGLPTLPR
jgi:hypothetical protein